MVHGSHDTTAFLECVSLSVVEGESYYEQVAYLC